MGLIGDYVLGFLGQLLINRSFGANCLQGLLPPEFVAGEHELPKQQEI